MPVSQSTQSKVENLANAINEGTVPDHPMPHSGWMVLKTSNPFADDEDESSDGLFLVGKQARLYQEALQALENDEAVEQLTRATLDEALFALVLSHSRNRRYFELSLAHHQFARIEGAITPTTISRLTEY